MAAGRVHRPKVKSFWILVRRLLLRKNHRPPASAREDDAEGEKSGLLCRSSLEELLVTDDATGDDAVCRGAKKHGQPVAVLQPLGLQCPVLVRPEAAAAAAAVSAAGGGRDGAAAHRRFMFGGFRRRLLLRRPWRPMLVAIPE
ncbi:hypothetical protein ACP70R_031211 [Stipagrostis hirtigluma subsp. patula]